MNATLDSSIQPTPDAPACDTEPRPHFRLALRQVNLRDARAVWQRHSEVYLRLWRMQLIAPLIEPVFMIFAFGWGIGSLIASNVAGVPYLAFVGAGVLCFAVISRALFETTYGSYFRMVYQSTFDAILATPVEIESLAFAELLWATTKALVDSLIILVVLFLFDVTRTPLAILAIVPLVFGSLFIAAVSLNVTAHVRDIDSYNLYIALFFSVIFVCGVWFPVDALPAALQYVSWAIPLTSAIEIARALLTNNLALKHLWMLAYLVVVSLLCTESALRSMRRRMVV